MTALRDVKEQIISWISSLGSKEIDKLASHLESGKMLRSKLILNVAGENKESILLCSIVEMIQTASLLHDDVIDNSTTRRGKTTINADFGDKNAIMLGDIFYSKAFVELTYFATNFPEIPRIIANSVVLLARGELLDVALSKHFNASEEKYLSMIADKTASLIEASANSAAILAHKDTQSFKIYGRNLGLAFQIIDDILDITSSNEILGKPSMSDFREGKTTLPYIYLYQELSKEEQECLLSLFKKQLNKEEQEWIQNKMKKHKTIEKSFKLAQNLGNEAIKALDNQSCDKLTEIMQTMINRNF